MLSMRKANMKKPSQLMAPYDALVLTLCINGFDVHRVLVDPGSVADLCNY